MAQVPEDLGYTEEHEYVRSTESADEVQVGITDYAQSELGDVVYVELPTVGDSFERMDVFGTIEAVKAVSDLYCPISGEVVAVNGALDDDPSLVNSDPYGEGWMIRLRARDPSEMDSLLAPDAYRSLIEE
ncbi:MAG: glycine cleavage system protein GcvH [Gemmatimonadota bacterium]|jgi:glycine cleavage system H protein|nr:MAG: glycine cleavage system protein GcvH [Gemmatimonadota bacterium]